MIRFSNPVVHYIFRYTQAESLASESQETLRYSSTTAASLIYQSPHYFVMSITIMSNAPMLSHIKH